MLLIVLIADVRALARSECLAMREAPVVETHVDTFEFFLCPSGQRFPRRNVRWSSLESAERLKSARFRIAPRGGTARVDAFRLHQPVEETVPRGHLLAQPARPVSGTGWLRERGFLQEVGSEVTR